MKVRVANTLETSNYPDLTPGNIYHVIGIECDELRIMNDEGQPYLYPPALFELVDEADSPGWITTFGGEGERYSYADSLNAIGFFEDYFDGSRQAAFALAVYMTKLTGRTK